MARPTTSTVGDRGRTVEAAVAAAVDYLRHTQDPAGWWKGELATNVTMDAEDLLLREFLGIRGEQETAEAARWIRSQQRDDGTWANFHGGPGDLSTTVEAWVALRLAGDSPRAAHLAKAADFIRGCGGVERTRVFTRIWLALFGLWPWDRLPVLPPEIIWLPKWVPLNIYDWACWARQTVVPLTIVSALRPVRPVAFDVDELCTREPAPPAPPVRTWAGAFALLDRLLRGYGRHPIAPLRRRAMRRAEAWILARQEADGSWGGIQPPWVYSLLALHLRGYPLDHPALASGLAGLASFTIREQGPSGAVRRIEACQSPVWDTGLAMTALLDAGVSTHDDCLIRAADWLLGQEIRARGDWTVRRPGLAAGGWAFEFANDHYPDIDDTAEVVLALRRVSHPEAERVRVAVERGVAWVVGMRSRDGGWGAFDADNTRTLLTMLPFCDFGAVIDPPSADVTAHVVEMLAAEGCRDEPACQAGVSWLLAHQESDGSWFGRWGANYVYGTGAVVVALAAAGVDPREQPLRGAARWLCAHQNADGGWGEDLRSYHDPAWHGRGTSTASQTAWALLALFALGSSADDEPGVDELGIEELDIDELGIDGPGIGEPDIDGAARRGVSFLVARQRNDGTWDESEFTGTGFPGYFYINYHLYRHVFPLSALGRYLAGRS